MFVISVVLSLIKFLTLHEVVSVLYVCVCFLLDYTDWNFKLLSMALKTEAANLNGINLLK